MAVAAALAFSMLLLFVPPVADLLGQANPPLWGWLVALSAAPILLAVDAFDKRLRARRGPQAHAAGGMGPRPA
jgi:hypothetical protein